MSRAAIRFDGPVVIAQSDVDPGDMGEPRQFDQDGVTYITVPSFRFWGRSRCALSGTEQDCDPICEETCGLGRAVAS